MGRLQETWHLNLVILWWLRRYPILSTCPWPRSHSILGSTCLDKRPISDRWDSGEVVHEHAWGSFLFQPLIFRISSKCAVLIVMRIRKLDVLNNNHRLASLSVVQGPTWNGRVNCVVSMNPSTNFHHYLFHDFTMRIDIFV